jgi:hypothetical protein
VYSPRQEKRLRSWGETSEASGGMITPLSKKRSIYATARHEGAPANVDERQHVIPETGGAGHD